MLFASLGELKKKGKSKRPTVQSVFGDRGKSSSEMTRLDSKERPPVSPVEEEGRYKPGTSSMSSFSSPEHDFVSVGRITSEGSYTPQVSKDGPTRYRY